MLMKCKNCDGTGLVLGRTDFGLGLDIKSCNVCYGKGNFDVPENKELCSKCNGKGTIHVPKIYVELDCKNCFGSGFIENKTS